MTIEKRQHQRFAVDIAAEITIGATRFSATTRDVSEGGVGLLVEQPIEQGALVSIAIFFTQDGIEDPDVQPFEGEATVAWAAPADGGRWQAGLRFEPVSGAQQEQLRSFLAHQSA